MTNKALDYAEKNLGVHQVFIDAQAARDKLDDIYTELSNLQDSKRDLQDRIIDVEMLVASEERGKHPDMSQTSMDKHLKVALNANGDYKTLRDQLRKVVGDIEGLEYDVRMVEHDIKIAVSRMNQLGGYFNYLAAVKNNTKPT